MIWIALVSFSREARRDATIVLTGLLWLLAASGKTGAQAVVPVNPVTTLRVYENLIQIPVVVLGPTMELMRPIAPNRFYVSLDSGPQFQASHVRPEGDDPIALSVLIDMSSDAANLAGDLSRAVRMLPADSLNSHDRVSVYALRHCELWRTAYNEVPDRALLGARIGGIYQNWPGGWKKPPDPACGRRLLLFGGLTKMVQDLAGQPGRRVVLVLGSGEDAGSKQGWAEVAGLAAMSGVTVFGLRHAEGHAVGFSSSERGFETDYRALCESSGGLVFSTTSLALRERLKDFLGLLRKRYIVEFPRPDDIEGGKHDIQVSISHSNAFVRWSGISVPIADQKTLQDPSTLKSDPALAPQVGKRKPLETPHR